MMKHLPPFDAYKGDKPYIFISYSHKDSAAVFSIIVKFYEKGYPIWYDEGIEPGKKWTSEIAAALASCALFIVFISPRSIASVNVGNEIDFALTKNLPVLAIHLKETALPDELQLQIGPKQAIMKYKIPEDSFYTKCCDAFEKYGITPVGDREPPRNLFVEWMKNHKAALVVIACVMSLAVSIIALWPMIANGISPVIASSTPKSSVVESSASESSVSESSVEESPAEPQTITIGGEAVAVDVTELIVDNKDITDISALRELTSLERLSLKDNNIRDIGALAELTELERLYLTNNNISDISVLSGLINLKTLYVSGNPLTQSQVGELQKALRSCTIYAFDLTGDETQPQTITIGGLTVDVNVKQLDLSNGGIGLRISDISALRYLTNLETLNLSANNIIDISALSRLTNLSELWLADNNNISDIGALEGLTNLEVLSLGHIEISDISALTGLANLKTLNMEACGRIYDFSALSELELESLNLNGTNISDLSVLSGLTNLKTLNLNDINIGDISALGELTNLNTLYLKNNNISNINALSELTNLNTLFLDTNNISDIRALSGLTKLQMLSLNENSISDISALSGLNKLKVLWLSKNNISDISALATLINLRQLHIKDNPLTQSQIGELRKALPNCSILF
jgi:Leucine-rich repeat (LRR) protein